MELLSSLPHFNILSNIELPEHESTLSLKKQQQRVYTFPYAFWSSVFLGGFFFAAEIWWTKGNNIIMLFERYDHDETKLPTYYTDKNTKVIVEVGYREK